MAVWLTIFRSNSITKAKERIIVMNLANRGRQAIANKHNLTGQEKRIKIKELDFEL